jgi:hypothetical protein
MKQIQFRVTQITRGVPALPKAVDRRGIEYGMYCDNTPEAEFVVLQLDHQLQGECLRTHLGRIELPVSENQPGPRVMYTRLTNVGEFQIAAKSHSAGFVWHWKERGWERRAEISHGNQAHIFDQHGNLIVQTPGPDKDSQGYRYVDPVRGVVGGSDTYSDRTALARELGVKNLWEWTYIDGIAIGQGEDGVIAQIQGKRKKIESGDCRFIQFKKTGAKISLAFPRFAQKDAILMWLTVDELLAMPDETPTTPRPPICATVYTRGEGGLCPTCQHLKAVHPQKEQPVSVPDRSAFAREFLGPRLGLVGNMEETRANTFEAVNAGCVELQKTDRKWGLLEKTGGDRVRDRAADIWLYDLGDGTAQVVDVVANGEGAPERPGEPRKAPSPAWSVKDIRPISQWRAPYGAVVIPSDPVTHKYDGGGNDTDICDRCSKPRTDPVHAIPESKIPHAYDGGEQDTGICDVCGRGLADALHQAVIPDPGPDPTNHKFVGSGRFCSECGKGPADPIHKIAEPIPAPGGGGVDAETKELLRKILASNLNQEKKLEEIRLGVEATGKKIEAALGGEDGGIIDLFRKKKP